MLFDRDGHACQFNDVIVRNAKGLAVRFVDIDCVHGLTGFGVVTVDHLDGLTTDVLAQDRKLTCVKGRFVDVELIRVDGALHDSLPESV